ncbi:MAG TPA: ATP-binding protein [Methylomirabilota bacterium]|nr:ATP-binding protein [Methylomirabilota bacterium]
MNLPQFVRWATGIRWQWKVFIPIVAVLTLSIATIMLVLNSLQVYESQWILVAALAGAIVLCFVLLAVLLVLIERPLEELMYTIKRVRNGDLNARVAFAKRVDDVGQLGRQFNEMVEQLEKNREEIEDLHHREMARAEHLATLGELAAGLAHEIRNPLAGIAGVVDIMGKDLPPNSASRAVLGDVHREVLHIQAILNDLLSYARPRPPAFHAANINTTVEQAVVLARQQVLTKPIQVLFESNLSLPLVEHDPALIQQVVLNITLNGIQAISGTGQVSLALLQNHDNVAITITDTGRGISADALPRIFKPFFTTRSEGTGLGLSLANGIVQSHGGHIDVTSTVGMGTTFKVSLPFARPKHPAGKSSTSKK